MANEVLRRRAGAAEAERAKLGKQLRQQGGLVDAAEAELAALRDAVAAAGQQARQLQEALSGYHRRTQGAAARQEELLGATRDESLEQRQTLASATRTLHLLEKALHEIKLGMLGHGYKLSRMLDWKYSRHEMRD